MTTENAWQCTGYNTRYHCMTTKNVWQCTGYITQGIITWLLRMFDSVHRVELEHKVSLHDYWECSTVVGQENVTMKEFNFKFWTVPFPLQGGKFYNKSRKFLQKADKGKTANVKHFLEYSCTIFFSLPIVQCPWGKVPPLWT